MADTAAQKACSYILNRIQTDPDLRYYSGPLTETFQLLCAAEAEYTGRSLSDVVAKRSRDLQPEYRTRQPEVLALRARLETAVDVDIEAYRADRDYYKAAYSRKLDDEKQALQAAQAAVAENASLKESVKRLSYLATDRGYGVWRCVKCDIRYATLPGIGAVCGNSIFTEKGSVPCHGKLEPFAPEADKPRKQEAGAVSAEPRLNAGSMSGRPALSGSTVGDAPKAPEKIP